MDDIFDSSIKKKKGGEFTYSNSLTKKELCFDGHNQDITEPYFWHLNFPYLIARGFTPIKLEDYHYFSEANQYGANMRQVKGGTIKAFEENLTQLIQLVKVHLMPLLKEVKQAQFYKAWIDRIVKNDAVVQELLKEGKTDEDKELKKARDERNEAISHIKDKWANEVDGGRIWQINKSAQEQGLDFALLPQLFFGISLDDPLGNTREGGKTLKEQLDSDIYPIDISEGAKEQVARFMYKFYTWLPTAISETHASFNIKVASLKQFYTQIQMYIQIMKPLLKEMARKSEGFESSSFFHNFDMENPEFISLLDTSSLFIKVLYIFKFERSKKKIEDLEFTHRGLFISKDEIKAGQFKDREGFITKESKTTYRGKEVKSYIFVPYEENSDTKEREYKEKEKGHLIKTHLRHYEIISTDFSQKRQMDQKETPQGIVQIPYMRNKITYDVFVWDIVEIATYREELKIKDLDLLESFIAELQSVKEELLYYIKDEYLKGDSPHFYKEDTSKKEKKEDIEPKRDNSKWTKDEEQAENDVTISKLNGISSLWKTYTIFKKSHGLFAY